MLLSIFFHIMINIYQFKSNSRKETRVVHRLGRVGFRPNPNLTRRRWVKRKGTRNRLLASINRIGFRFGWCSGMFGRFWVVAGAANVTEICSQKKSARICKIMAEKCKNSPNLHQNHRNLHQNHWNLLGFS